MKHPKQHRIASYNAGCRCPACRAANRDARRKYRERDRQAIGKLPGDKMCGGCGLWFRSRGLSSHQRTCLSR